MTLAWLNLYSLLIGSILFYGFYIPSVMPATRAERRGNRAWKESKWMRTIATICWMIQIVNIILWYWIPIFELAWPISLNPFLGIILALIILTILLPIMIKGMIDAGEECVRPSKESQLFDGIYNYIRHPQTLGEMGLYFVAVLFVNSLFLLIVMFIFSLLYLPVMIHYEEKDLIKRFGDDYREYKRNTGAFIPKFWKKKEQ